jgi:hypothetical protein
MKRTPFHVYAEDGFEGAFASERSARAAAKRGSKARGIGYRIIVVGPAGYTGGGAGRVLAEFHKGKESGSRSPAEILIAEASRTKSGRRLPDE